MANRKIHKNTTTQLVMGAIAGIVIGSFIPDKFSPLALLKKS